MRTVIGPIILGMLLPVMAVSQRNLAQQEEQLATVEVTAFSTLGGSLGVPEIYRFIEVSQGKDNLAERFRKGVANNIPEGIYLIEAGLPGFTREFRIVRIFQKHVSV